MDDTNNKAGDGARDFFLDITGEVCPLTFVRTKLLLEKMVPGQTAEIHLKGKEPLLNVPRSVKDHGHEVMSLAPLDGGAEVPDTVHRLVIRKT
ncbi:MAG: sulfurtransferase TusA family protein [Magnetospirillum sp. WYHS-4]